MLPAVPDRPGGRDDPAPAQSNRSATVLVLIKPSRLTSSAEVEAFALRTQFYEVLLAHILDRFGQLLRHGSRSAINGQNAICCTGRYTDGPPRDAPAQTVTTPTFGQQYSRQLITRPHQHHSRPVSVNSRGSVRHGPGAEAGLVTARAGGYPPFRTRGVPDRAPVRSGPDCWEYGSRWPRQVADADEGGHL